MKSENILGYVFLCFILLIMIKCYYDSDYFQLKCIVSDVNGKKYCVRERSKIQQASDLLANTTQKMQSLVTHLEKNHAQRPEVQRLIKNFNPDKIKEILPTSEYTAYSENKGEKIAFCLSSKDKKDLNQLIEPNTLMFVAIHEMSHLASKTIGHNDEFWTNFKFLLTEAVSIQIYTPIDYKKDNKEYCGMQIKDNPFFDSF